jgi:hypothetical protein
MTDVVITDKKDVLKAFEKAELIEKVMDKHRRFVNEYSSEFTDLEQKLESLNEIITSSTTKKEDVLNKVEILTEKRQLFYHQAEKHFDELKGKVSSPEVLRELGNLYAELLKLKSAFVPDVESEHVNSFFMNLSSVSLPSGAIGIVASIKTRVSEAVSSNVALHQIIGKDVDYENEKLESEKTLGELTPRYNWIKGRLSSHKDALDYWDKVSTGQNVEMEVKA